MRYKIKYYTKISFLTFSIILIVYNLQCKLNYYKYVINCIEQAKKNFFTYLKLIKNKEFLINLDSEPCLMSISYSDISLIECYCGLMLKRLIYMIEAIVLIPYENLRKKELSFNEIAK
ncbi:hypothetical protein Avbf_03857 [Armadillidium vulgare]|nr:hypothetical protein Avbf_03857 [Armadillidium vulgare]